MSDYFVFYHIPVPAVKPVTKTWGKTGMAIELFDPL
jgi:hypothetical protein